MGSNGRLIVLMLGVKEYFYPDDFKEAYDLYIKEPRTSLWVSGGVAVGWIKPKNIKRLIDLNNCVGSYDFKVKDDFIISGSCVSLSDFIDNLLSSSLKTKTSTFLINAFKEVAFYQLRNMATIGGSIAQKFGWSDVITALLVLDTELDCIAGDSLFCNIKLQDFLYKKEKLLIRSVKIPLNKFNRMVFIKYPVSNPGIALLNCAFSCSVEDGYIKDVRVVFGARPFVAKRLIEVEKLMFEKKIIELKESMDLLIDTAKKEARCGSTLEASKDYRNHLISVSFKRFFDLLLD